MAQADGVLRGAYILSREPGAIPDIILIATGSEVHLALEAQSVLAGQHRIDARVVSMPSWEMFREQPQDYRNDVLPIAVKIRLAIEAGSPHGWCEWVGDHGGVVGINRFGASAPAKQNFSHFGFTVENLIDQACKLLGR
jgi:transketolase